MNKLEQLFKQIIAEQEKGNQTLTITEPLDGETINHLEARRIVVTDTEISWVERTKTTMMDKIKALEARAIELQNSIELNQQMDNNEIAEQKKQELKEVLEQIKAAKER